jgi:WD40 repeat protein
MAEFSHDLRGDDVAGAGSASSGEAYRYWAFISYSHSDEKWAAWLHRRLENYSGHKAIAGTRNRFGEQVPTRIFPVFRDREDLAGAPDLPERIQEALRESRYLIVICSPGAAGSRWVNDEIIAFKKLGRESRVLALIVGGEASAADEHIPGFQDCFPPALRYRLGPDGSLSGVRTEPLAADARSGKDGKDNALLKLIAGILGVRFDELRRRDQQRQAQRLRWITGVALVAVAIFAGIAWYANDQRLLAQERARVALSRQLSVLAEKERAQGSLQRALLLSAAGYRAAPTHEATQSLYRALADQPQLLAFLSGHRDDVWSLAFSPDGSTLASASSDRSVILWDIASRKPVGKPLTGHRADVFAVAYSADGSTLASAGVDGTVMLWDAASRKPLGEPLKGHDVTVWSLAFSPDGNTLASASSDRTVILWDVTSRKSLMEPLNGHRSRVRSVAFSPDGATLASGSSDQTVMLWEAATGKPLDAPLKGHRSDVTSVAYSPDGRVLASGGMDGTVILWDVADRRALGEPLAAHERQITTVAFSVDGKTLATGSVDRSVMLWDVASRQPLAHF